MREMKDSGIEWIGEIPSDWSIVPFSVYLDSIPNAIVDGPFGSDMKNEEYVDEGIPVIQLGTIKEYNMDFSNVHFITDNKADSLYRHNAYPYDIAIAKMMPAGKTCEIPSTYSRYVVSADVIKASINSKYKRKYVVYALNSCATVQALIESQGSTRSRVNISKVKHFKLPKPQDEFYKKIVQYLDEKCSKIDSIIEKQQAIIDKLKEYKLSVITEAVTKGLNPDVKMKDSGVEWIGKIPINYMLSSFKRFCSVNQGLQIAQKDRKIEPGNNRYIYITVKYINSDSKDEIVEYIETPPVSTICKKEDVLLARTGATGLVVTGVEGCFHNNFFRINYDTQNLLHDYLVYYLEQDSVKNYFLLMAGTTTIPDLNHGDFYSTPLIIPPIIEQKKITAYLNDIVNRIDQKIAGHKEMIKKMREYKKSLIYEVVTGKKEV